MANLNLQDKKFITPENLKLIINYGLSFASRVKNLEDKEIAPFEADKLYTKDSLTIYDGYIYKAKVTNQLSTFNEIYWDLIGDDITELTKSDVEAMVGLSAEEIETLSKIILDSEIRLDKTFSSSKIYTDIQDAIQTSKDYTLTELSKMSGASYKVVTDVNEMTDEKIIYLIENGTTFDMYIVDSGTPTLIGDVSINLSDYYTKTEIDNDFLKKIDADSKYATITTVDGKIDKTNIATSLDDTVTDEKVTSALLTKTELDKLSASLGEKASKEEIKNFKNVYSYPKTLGITIENGQDNTLKVFDALGVGERYQDYWGNSSSTSKWGIAESYGNTVQIEIVKVGSVYGVCTAMTNKGITLQRYINTTMTTMPGWKELATVSNVKNVGVTTIRPASSNITGTIKYTVKNGICYVSLKSVKSTTTGSALSISTTMPKPAISCSNGIINDVGSYVTGCVYINENTTQLKANFYNTTYAGSCSFSYPVAE